MTPRFHVPDTALEIREVHKSFGGVHALRGVNFSITQGEVVGLLGDNGAGKSTLVRCISGVHPADQGQILIKGKEVNIHSPHDARSHGIETVFQDLAVIPNFDVVRNLFLNREILSSNPLLRLLGWLDHKEMKKQSEIALRRLNSRIPSIDEEIRNLSGGQRQAVSIARAVNWGADLVIMDEPTAALGVEQSAQVNKLIKLISSQGVSVLLISHNIQHVMEVCNRAVVLRHGRIAANVAIEEITPDDLVGLITGAKQAA
ncbi:ATP-binding cassette domain-containing protein [Kiloniella laminariae]|uniref:ATP-binding cassette domain-containing protein n=1 Tax=Kiloniella laminariae TaxID=454162 RepID=UPI00037C20AD|nr:ATP-binding cassette domain-containing protein [Kiloniella laminariae]